MSAGSDGALHEATWTVDGLLDSSKAAAVGADAVMSSGPTLFGEPMSIENEIVSPRAVSCDFTALRHPESPPTSSGRDPSPGGVGVTSVTSGTSGATVAP